MSIIPLYSMTVFCDYIFQLFKWIIFGEQMAAYEIALRSRADCIEIDVSRSSDGVLFALHDRCVTTFNLRN